LLQYSIPVFYKTNQKQIINHPAFFRELAEH